MAEKKYVGVALLDGVDDIEVVGLATSKDKLQAEREAYAEAAKHMAARMAEVDGVGARAEIRAYLTEGDHAKALELWSEHWSGRDRYVVRVREVTK